MVNDEETLQHFSVQSLYEIHVIDNDPESILKELEDVSLVQKYEMSDADYNNKEDTCRKFKAANPDFFKKKNIISDAEF